MTSSIVLAVFIASAATFDAGVLDNSAYRHAAFPNSHKGIEQLGQWLEKSGLHEFDRVCVSGPPIDATPAAHFWATRKVEVIAIDFARIKQYMKEHNIGTASANVVARTCLSLLPRK